MADEFMDKAKQKLWNAFLAGQRDQSQELASSMEEERGGLQTVRDDFVKHHDEQTRIVNEAVERLLKRKYPDATGGDTGPVPLETDNGNAEGAPSRDAQ